MTLNHRDFEKVTECHSNWYHSKAFIYIIYIYLHFYFISAVSYSPSIVTMAVSLTVYEIFSATLKTGLGVVQGH